MMRPRSIVTFEQCYLGAWLLGLVNLALGWNARIEMATMAAAQSSLGAGSVSSIIVAGAVLGSVITLVLWWFTARRASVVAKWIVTVFFGFGVLGLLSGLARGTTPAGLAGLLTVVTLVLQAIAVAMLFRPDAKAWFGERTAGL